MTTHVRDHNRAFEDAIHAGIMTETSAAQYMYMHTDSQRGDAFKHSRTKEYLWNNKIRYKLKRWKNR